MRSSGKLPGFAAIGGAVLLVGIAATLLWMFIQHHELTHWDEIVEREADAARTRFALDLERQFQALHNVSDYWSDYAYLPHDQWGKDAQIELAHFDGFQRLAWHDPAKDVRYATTRGDDWDFKRQPTAPEWAEIKALLARFPSSERDRLIRIEPDSGGGATYAVKIPAHGPSRTGYLMAVVNATTQAAQLLDNQSPGYAVTVSWDGEEIYRRGRGAEQAPDRWRSAGSVDLPIDGEWRLAHIPSPQLARRMQQPILSSVLIAGWIIALLVGGLVYQWRRLGERARSAGRTSQEVQALNDQLEAGVGERTQDLETVTHSVGHDLRGPLNVVSMSSQLIRTAAPDKKILSAVERIDRAVVQATDVLERLHAYSVAALGEVRRKRVDMQALAGEICATLSPEGSNKVGLGELPACLAEPSLVEVLLYNLVDDALRYRVDGHADAIDIGAVPGSRPTVYFVEDDGSGLDGEEEEAAFPPHLHLGEPGVSERGLGLLIVRRIVNRHQGRIWAETEPGLGTTVKFHFGEDSAID